MYLYLASTSVLVWKVDSKNKNNSKLMRLAFIFLIYYSKISLMRGNKGCSQRYSIYQNCLSSIDLRFFLSSVVNNYSRYVISFVVQGSISQFLSFASQFQQIFHKLQPASTLLIFFSEPFSFPIQKFIIRNQLIIELIIIEMSLIGRRILVTGGNGYLGNYFAARFVQQKATVMALSRSGTKHTHPENSQIQWLKGNILDPTPLKDKINSADTIVHTIGTLFDTSVTNKAKPGAPGTYEQINRDTFSSLLGVLEGKKKVIYISSAGHPPFLSRYLSTKYEAEQMLEKSEHEGYSLRPGFIYSWEHRKWSIPIKWSIDVWNNIYPLLQKIVPGKNKASRLLREFKQGENVALEDLGSAILQLTQKGGANSVCQVKDIDELSMNFRKDHSK